MNTVTQYCRKGTHVMPWTGWEVQNTCQLRTTDAVASLRNLVASNARTRLAPGGCKCKGMRPEAQNLHQRWASWLHFSWVGVMNEGEKTTYWYHTRAQLQCRRYRSKWTRQQHRWCWRQRAKGLLLALRHFLHASAMAMEGEGIMQRLWQWGQVRDALQGIDDGREKNISGISLIHSIYRYNKGRRINNGSQNNG